MKQLFKHQLQLLRKCKRKVEFVLASCLEQVRLRYPRIYTSVVRAYREAVDFLSASGLACSNNRTLAGLLLICVATPLAGIVYVPFDSTVEIEGWYYSNFFWLFYVLSPHLQMLLTLTGIFLVLPEDSKRAYFLLIPAGYHIAKIIWYSQVSSDEEIREMMPHGFLIIGLTAGYAWLRAFSQLAAIYCHTKMSKVCTAKGALDCKDIPDAEARAIASQQLGLFMKLQ